MKKKILITGGAGFIFSNFIRNLLYKRNDFTIVNIDNLSSPHSFNNLYANKGNILHVGDVSDSSFVDSIFQIEKPDIVIHGAAQSRVDDSIASAVPFIKSNVLGTQVMVDAALKYDIDRFILISTDEVFGHLESEDDDPWVEGDITNPRNPYAASKMCSELVVKAAHVTHGLKYNITRSCNNLGPRQSIKNLIPKIIKCILNKEKMPIYGEGKQVREWIHVFDNCAAIMTILENGAMNETYNISTNWEISNIELFIKICDILGGGHDLVKFIPDPRPGHDFRYSIDGR